MTGPKTECRTECRKMETEIVLREGEIRNELAELVPLIHDLPAEAIDDELIVAVDDACKRSSARADQAEQETGGRRKPAGGAPATG